MRGGALKRSGVCRAVFTWSALTLGVGAGNVGLADGHATAAADVAAESEAATDAKVRGVELGEYRIRADYPVEAQKSIVRFVLHGAVASERFAEAQRVVEARRHKLRDEVITATRMTPLDVFDEADLTRFRRRILVRLRRALPELPLDDVYVGDFQLTVKSL